MKRPMPWSDKEDDSSSDESSSNSSGSEAEDGAEKSARRPSEVKSMKRKGGGIDYEALKRHGYKGGLSVLKVPPPKVGENRDWSWSTGKEKTGTGKDKTGDQDTEESYRERQKTRAAIADGEELATAITQKEKKSFAQKEKRKRDLGQTSRGKNYVEEEKRMLRDNGVYSGFDS
ncbi:uncharacterized protein LOC141608455 [Silene latifolia]|uniref:uncharacterized protein LOC141608455 n=1 Tax=Silene latifolia TaxID=37657 RepID=UPI003D76F71F